MDGNVLVISLANKVFVYTGGRGGDNNDDNKWRRESLFLPSGGN